MPAGLPISLDSILLVMVCEGFSRLLAEKHHDGSERGLMAVIGGRGSLGRLTDYLFFFFFVMLFLGGANIRLGAS